MNVFGILNNDKREFNINNKIINSDNILVYIKGTIFNLNEIKLKYKIKSNNINNIIKILYKNNNLNFVKNLDGNFLIIIYDFHKDVLYLVNDKLGSEHIYYYFKNNDFVFSTSLKMILNSNFVSKKIDKQVLSNYLGYSYIYEPYTIFENIYKVPKGSILKLQKLKMSIKKYYSLEDEYLKLKEEEENKTYEKLAIEYEQLFIESIKKRGNIDSQVGIFMSSGKDSTLLAQLSSNYFNKKVNTYTLGFNNERDESYLANNIANYIGSNHHCIMLNDKSVMQIIKKIPKYYEEPFADPSIIPSIYMIEHIKDNNDFYLAGEGNDSIFIASAMYNVFNFIPRTKLLIRKYINILMGKRTYKNFNEMAQINIINRFNYSDKIINCKGKVYELPKCKNKRMRSVIGDLNNTVPEKYRVKTSSLTSYYDYKYYTPYYDPPILDKIFSTPINKLYNNKKGKYIFDNVLYRNIPSQYFNNYKKMGFGFPTIDWVNRIMMPDIKKISTQKYIENQNIFDYCELVSLFKSFEKKPNYDKAIVIWNYYVFQLWYIENI